MKNREIELFNLSFLDLLSGALGAVIFLFIIVPKGQGEAPLLRPQLTVMYDTVQQHFFGMIPDSLIGKVVGDSVLAIITEYRKMPSIEDCPPPRECPVCPEIPSLATTQRKTEKPVPVLPAERPEKESSVSSSPSKASGTSSNKYKGPQPSVPCKLSIELKWKDPQDNVDLFVCKDGDCVFGGRRFRSFIGYWDSGKSRTSIFGGDLRTSQEAVRQFETILPGEYKIIAQYKQAVDPKDKLPIEGLVYTNSPEKGESGKEFTFSLPLSERERTQVGTLTVHLDGSFNFQMTYNN